MAAAPKLKPVFSLNSLQSAQWSIEVENLVTQTQFPAQPMTHLLEIHERGVVLEVPEKNCAQGHHVGVKIRYYRQPSRAGSPSPPENFTATAQVKEYQHEPGTKTDRITLEWKQFDEVAWREMKSSLAQLSQQVQDLFQRLKGES